MSRIRRRVLQVAFLGIGLAVATYFAWHWIRVVQFYSGPSEATLEETGFDWAAAKGGELSHTYAFAPAYPFWSDGATKERYVQIPPGTKIDTSDPDRWNFPQGTRIWKVFVKDEVLVETRMLFKHAHETGAWDMAVYQPDRETGVSVKLALGKDDVAGTMHDIPAPSECVTCHSSGEQRRPLGVTAIQLPWTSEDALSIQKLIAKDLLTDSPDGPATVPGDERARAALGYLHSNCGSCHYEGSTHVTDKVPLRMNLTADTLSAVESTNVYRTAIAHQPHLPGLGTEVYILPGAPQESFLWRRMSIRDGGAWQMPPLATEVVDEHGVALIEAWISRLNQDTSGNNSPAE